MSDLALDLGCGKNKRKGATGLDMNPSLEGIIDVIHEAIDRTSLPFKDDSFSTVYMSDFIEHLSFIPWLLSEVHRVSVGNAVVEVRFPHYSSTDAHSDATHIHHGFGLHALDHFDPSTEFGKKYMYYTQYGRYFPFKIESIQPEFGESLRSRLKKLLYNAIGPDFYERKISKFLPLDNIIMILRVMK